MPSNGHQPMPNEAFCGGNIFPSGIQENMLRWLIVACSTALFSTFPSKIPQLHNPISHCNEIQNCNMKWILFLLCFFLPFVHLTLSNASKDKKLEWLQDECIYALEVQPPQSVKLLLLSCMYWNNCKEGRIKTQQLTNSTSQYLFIAMLFALLLKYGCKLFFPLNG